MASVLRKGLLIGFVLQLSLLSNVHALEQPISAITYPNYPQTTLDNGQIQVRIYLPNAQTGYYRGTRFDWSGVISRVLYAGHTYYGEWKATHDPANHDDIPGPVEEFGMFTPLGYATAKVREPFTKIGVGNLIKSGNQAYSFAAKYPIQKAGTWDVRQASDSIEFTQEFDSGRGYAYHYTKRIELLFGQPAFRISRSLINSGTQTIDTEHYNHNFTVIDDEPIGPHYQVEFPFPVQAAQSLSGIAKVEGTKVVFVKDLKTGSIFSELKGYSDSPAHNRITIYNQSTQAGVQITGDRPLYKLNFWSTVWAACPEPFIQIRIAPGEEMRWSADYTFFTANSIPWKPMQNP